MYYEVASKGAFNWASSCPPHTAEKHRQDLADFATAFHPTPASAGVLPKGSSARGSSPDYTIGPMEARRT